MNKKMIKKVLGLAVIGGSIVGGILCFKKLFKNNYLKRKKLIDKSTAILNVYTADYVEAADPFVEVQEEKEGLISHVFTKRAKVKLIAGEEALEKKSAGKKEFKQIVKFAREIYKLKPNVLFVVHATTSAEIEKYSGLNEHLKSKYNIDLNVKVETKIKLQAFEEKE